MRSSPISRYRRKTPNSQHLYQLATRIFAGGINHNTRFYRPYPFFATRAKGPHLWDADGNQYTDYWMGHTSLILGHNPPPVTAALEAQVKDGILYGTANEISVRMGELVCKAVPCAELLRFCTTGAEATMYATRLARAYTKKRIALKVEGGWHGYSHSLLKGVLVPFEEPESLGLLAEEQRYVKTVPFNNTEATLQAIREDKSDLACFILEPVLGAGGCIPADPEYLHAVREETARRDVLLIFDEIITGFRLALGGAQQYYRVEPDLVTLGKILGGGLPVGAVAGIREVMRLADPALKKNKSKLCRIGGGTFSCHPLTMATGLAMLTYLREHEAEIYPRLDKLGERARSRLNRLFDEYRISAQSTGIGSLLLTHFLRPAQTKVVNSSDAYGGDRERQHEYHLRLMVDHGILFLPGHLGAISCVHRDADITRLIEASEKIAQEGL